MVAGVAAPASVNGLTFVGWQQPIGCGGCAIFTGDIIVADDDGAVVIPQAMLEFVARDGAEHELYESWVFSEVENGVKLPGLYPPDDDAKARYAAWRKAQSWAGGFLFHFQKFWAFLPCRRTFSSRSGCSGSFSCARA